MCYTGRCFWSFIYLFYKVYSCFWNNFLWGLLTAAPSLSNAYHSTAVHFPAYGFKRVAHPPKITKALEKARAFPDLCDKSNSDNSIPYPKRKLKSLLDVLPINILKLCKKGSLTEICLAFKCQSTAPAPFQITSLLVKSYTLVSTLQWEIVPCNIGQITCGKSQGRVLHYFHRPGGHSSPGLLLLHTSTRPPFCIHFICLHLLKRLITTCIWTFT